MKLARIKFSETQVRMLVVGQTVRINLPDGEIHLTMDTSRIELRKAADKLRDLSKNRGKSKFDDLFGDIFGKGDDPFSDLFS